LRGLRGHVSGPRDRASARMPLVREPESPPGLGASALMVVRVAVAPADRDDLASDIEAAGGTVVAPDEADAVVWVDPSEPEALSALLAQSPARWIQLPFAGIEGFFAAGVVDPARTWTCAKGIYGHSTAEHALTLVLAGARRLDVYARAVAWSQAGGERMLKSCTVLIVGTGGIGGALADMLVPLGPRIVAVNRSGWPLAGAATTVAFDGWLEIIPEADFVVLAPALTPTTRGMVDRKALAAMKEGAWVVNVGRGPLIVTDDLVEALREGRIGGAALDVTDPEPLPAGHPLWSAPNALITPHVANTWNMALPELRALVRRNVARYGEGAELEGLVDPEAGY
jgi:phosphoglycerate dehydrogenase-like enzyme